MVDRISTSQPIAYTGAHLAQLEAMYAEEVFFPLECILTRVMIIGALVRMVADSARYGSHALTEIWRHRKITNLASNSLARAGRHISLALFTCAFGLLLPSLIIRVARRAAMLPHHCWLSTVEANIIAVAYTTLSLIACYCAAHAALFADRLIHRLPLHHLKKWALRFGRTNVKAASVATAVISASTVSYQLGMRAYEWGSTNGWWVCYRIVAYICLPRNFSL